MTVIMLYDYYDPDDDALPANSPLLQAIRPRVEPSSEPPCLLPNDDDINNYDLVGAPGKGKQSLFIHLQLW